MSFKKLINRIANLEGDVTTNENRASQLHFLFWSIGWAGVLLLSSWVLKDPTEWGNAFRVLAALAPILVGVLAMRSFLIFFRKSDELTQRIHFEGIAYGFGAGIIITLALPLLHQIGIPETSLNIPFLVISLAWCLGQIRARVRYT